MAIQGRASDSEVIKELLSPWNILFTDFDEADIVVVYRKKPLETRKTLVIPSEYDAFAKPAEGVYSQFVRKSRTPISISAGPATFLTINPQTYFSNSPIELEKQNSAPTIVDDQGDFAFLTVDVVSEYHKILEEALGAKQSPVYRLLTGLPIPYTKAPKQLKTLIMRGKKNPGSLSFYDKLPLDALRFILVSAIKKLLNRSPLRKMWNEKKTAVVLTHDVETQDGLQISRKLQSIEHKYDVPSAWFVPSKRYKLDTEAVKALTNYGEVGAHDTKHDGKLAQITGNKLVERLREAKQTLEKLTEEQVIGFRSPLLQHNFRILDALRKARYAYDTSIPTWEPRHPNTMKPHGIATAFPLTLEGIIEIPVTLPQDHQLLHVLGLSPKEISREWMNMIDTIKGMGGLCTILMHPDYELAYPENLGAYEELLNKITSDSETLVALPKQIASLAQPC
jgi:peptidoglycan/xylan/chitin deacetylase (PgdA/CDA1 family)